MKKRPLTTDQGVPVSDNQNSLTAGERGPTLLQDVHLVEKLAHFDRERIPERVMHANGAGAHGYFQPYRSMSKYTGTAFLQRAAIKTPVFVRFSTVVGSKGSADTCVTPGASKKRMIKHLKQADAAGGKRVATGLKLK